MHIITSEIHSNKDAEKALKMTYDYYESIYQKLLESTKKKNLTFLSAKEGV